MDIKKKKKQDDHIKMKVLTDDGGMGMDVWEWGVVIGGMAVWV